MVTLVTDGLEQRRRDRREGLQMPCNDDAIERVWQRNVSYFSRTLFLSASLKPARRANHEQIETRPRSSSRLHALPPAGDALGHASSAWSTAAFATWQNAR